VNDYAERNALLERLGFSTYQDYLNSPLWARIREEVLRRNNRRCAICISFATQVHHRKYTRDNLNGSNYKHLSPICASCHKAIERGGDGKKLEPADVEAIFDACRSVQVNPTTKNQKGKKKWYPLTIEELAFQRSAESHDKTDYTKISRRRNKKKK
jgi:5-methylcytosine-specific restriction endonuclease McrA